MEPTSSCDYCHELFEEIWLLSCLHSVCLKCLQDVQNEFQVQGNFCCVLCQTPIPQDQQSRAVKCVSNISLVPCIECTFENPQAIRTHSCETCESYLCQDHVEQHLRSKRPAHVITMVPLIICRIHTQEVLKYDCTCHEVICSQCLSLEVHDEHQIEPLETGFNLLTNAITNQAAKLTSHLSTIENAVAQLQIYQANYTSNLLNIEADIINWFESLPASSDDSQQQQRFSRRQELLAEAQNHIKKSKDELLDQADDFEKFKTAIQQACLVVQTTATTKKSISSTPPTTAFDLASSMAFTGTTAIELINQGRHIHRRLQGLVADLRVPTQQILRFTAQPEPTRDHFQIQQLGRLCMGRDYVNDLNEAAVTAATLQARTYGDNNCKWIKAACIANTDAGDPRIWVLSSSAQSINLVSLNAPWNDLAVHRTFQIGCGISPRAICTTNTDEIVLATQENTGCVVVVDSNSHMRLQVACPSYPVGLAFVPTQVTQEEGTGQCNGKIVVTTSVDVRALSSDTGDLIWETHLPSCDGVASLDISGDIAVCHRSRIVILSGVNGNELRSIGGVDFFDQPRSVAVTRDDLLVVSDFSRRCISIWTLDGVQVHTWNCFNHPDSQSQPWTVSVLPDNRIVVTEFSSVLLGSKRILIF